MGLSYWGLNIHKVIHPEPCNFNVTWCSPQNCYTIIRKNSISMANFMSTAYELKPLHAWTKYSYKNPIFLPLYYTAEALKIALFCLNRGFSRSQKQQKLLILTLIYLIGKWSPQKHCLNRGFCLFWRCLNRGSTVLHFEKFLTGNSNLWN